MMKSTLKFYDNDYRLGLMGMGNMVDDTLEWTSLACPCINCIANLNISKAKFPYVITYT